MTTRGNVLSSKAVLDDIEFLSSSLQNGETEVGYYTGLTFTRFPDDWETSSVLSPDERGYRTRKNNRGGVRCVSSDEEVFAWQASQDAIVSTSWEAKPLPRGELFKQFSTLSPQEKNRILWRIDPIDGCFGDIESLRDPESDLKGIVSAWL